MRAPIDSRRLLAVYSGILTLVVAIPAFTATQDRKASFEEIDVQRINVVEPDGTTRLVLSSKARLPGILFEGVEYPHPNRRTAGILFFNDEGTENGGLTFGGARDANGNASAYGHLSFDQFNQDQVITFNATEDGGNRKAGVSVWDRPDHSIEELLLLNERVKDLPRDEQRAAMSAFLEGKQAAHPRLYLGKSHNGSVSLRLNDAQGRERLVIEVAPDGSPAVRFLDEAGNETARFPDSK